MLIGTGHTWRADQVRPRVRSSYLDAILAEAERQGEVRAEAAPPAASNPLVTAGAPVPWPAPYDPEAWRHRSEAAAAVDAARRRQAETGSYEAARAGAELLLDGLETTARWDADLERLLAELTAARSERTRGAAAGHALGDVPAAAASATRRGWRPRSPDRCRRHRPGRRGSAPGSTSGSSATSDRRWRPGSSVSSSCWIPTTCPTPPTSRPPTRRDCASSAPPSSPGAYGSRVPYAVEAPVTMLVEGTLVRGRIDAVYDLRSA